MVEITFLSSERRPKSNALGFVITITLFFVLSMAFTPLQLWAQTRIPLINPSFENPGLRKIKGWDGECADSCWSGLLVDIPGWASDKTVFGSGVESGSNAVHASTYLTTPTYDGSDQAIHPDVNYNPNGWHGYKYWMAMTPFPGGDPAYENPSILVSDDGQIWSVPAGLTNPIEPAPATGHYADTDILEGLDGKLWVFFNNGSSRVWAKSSADGIIWSAKTRISDYPACVGQKLGVWFDNVSLIAQSWIGLDNVALLNTNVSQVSEPSTGPTGFALAQNYPNPFNSRTEISYTLQNNSRIRLAVYDLAGREVAVLVDGDQHAGEHHTVLTGDGLPSGIYFFRLQTASGALTKKMILAR